MHTFLNVHHVHGRCFGVFLGKQHELSLSWGSVVAVLIISNLDIINATAVSLPHVKVGFHKCLPYGQQWAYHMKTLPWLTTVNDEC